MRQRLAVDHPPEYTAVRNNFWWPDHAARTFLTAGLVAWLAPDVICDPACGDASILEAAYRLRPFKRADLSDISAPQIAALNPSFPHTKKVEEIEAVLSSADVTDTACVLLTEILEHMPHPDGVLRLARARWPALIASVPIGDPEHGDNREHLWSWDEPSFDAELREAGWNPVAVTTVQLLGIGGNSQIWVAR